MKYGKFKTKTVIFDAGHNPHGVEFLLNQLRKFLKYNKRYTDVVAVFSMLADKDIASVTDFRLHIASFDKNQRTSFSTYC